MRGGGAPDKCNRGGTCPVDASMTEKVRRGRRWPYVIGAVVAALVVFVVLFRWDWLIPLIEPRASAGLGRPVHLSHLHVKLGRTVRIVADGVEIGESGQLAGRRRLSRRPTI